MNTEKLIVIVILMIVIIITTAITFVTIQPQDLVCRDFVRSTEDTYTMLDCYKGNRFNSAIGDRFDLVLRVESQVVKE